MTDAEACVAWAEQLLCPSGRELVAYNVGSGILQLLISAPGGRWKNVAVPLEVLRNEDMSTLFKLIDEAEWLLSNVIEHGHLGSTIQATGPRARDLKNSWALTG